MTDLLAEAFRKASELPEGLQNELAQQLLEELDGDRRWDETLASSPEKLARLAEQAKREFRAGETKPGGFGDR